MHQNCFDIAEVENCDRVQKFVGILPNIFTGTQMMHPQDIIWQAVGQATLDSFAILDVSYFPLAFRVGLYFVGLAILRSLTTAEDLACRLESNKIK